jgi:hypothetical protein
LLKTYILQSYRNVNKNKLYNNVLNLAADISTYSLEKMLAKRFTINKSTYLDVVITSLALNLTTSTNALQLKLSIAIEAAAR